MKKDIPGKATMMEREMRSPDLTPDLSEGLAAPAARSTVDRQPSAGPPQGLPQLESYVTQEPAFPRAAPIQGREYRPGHLGPPWGNFNTCSSKAPPGVGQGYL